MAPGILLAAAIGLWFVAPQIARRAAPESDFLGLALDRALLASLWLAATFLVVRGVELHLERRFARRSGNRPPGLLRLLIVVLAWTISLTWLASAAFDLSLTGAVATSSVVLAVLGFALRSLIADLFYGITMALERPFEIGDWIAGSDGTVGRVDEFTWRAVKLVTKDNLKIVLPNHQIAAAQVVNYHQPDPACRTKLRVCLAHEVEPERAKRLLLSAVEAVPESTALGRRRTRSRVAARELRAPARGPHPHVLQALTHPG